jgi:hypothetical protein
MPDAEFCRQMVSRGTRSFGAQEGVLFVRGDESQNRAFRARLLNTQGNEFHDGVKVIRAMHSAMKVKDLKTKVKEIIVREEGKWMIKFEDLLKELKPDERKQFESFAINTKKV